MLLDVANLTVSFAGLAAVRDVSFSIAPGEVLGLVGESGSGKSVTSLAIMRLLPPQASVCGSIQFNGADLLAASAPQMRDVRGAQIAMIFQEPMTALNPVMRVGDQVAEAALAHSGARERIEAAPPTDCHPERSEAESRACPERREGDLHFSPARIGQREAWALALQALRDVGIPDPERRARDYPHQLSGGQRQRVMIAMAIVNRPQLLIADEPTTALDVTIQAQILELLAGLRARFRLAMLFISHDLAVVSNVAGRIAVMYAGSIVEIGSRHDIFSAAAHPYTRGLLQAVPTLTTDRARPLRTIEGAVPALAALPPGCPFEPRCELRQPDCATALPPLVEMSPGHLARCPVVNPSTGKP